jgi:hypothetical protein
MKDHEVIVAEFHRGKNGDKVRAKLMAFKGTVYADIRLHETNAHGKVLPTKRGLSVPVSLLPELVKALQALVGATKDNGAARQRSKATEHESL